MQSDLGDSEVMGCDLEFRSPPWLFARPIAKGKLADVFVLSDDSLTIAPNPLRVQTIVGGRIVYGVNDENY